MQTNLISFEQQIEDYRQLKQIYELQRAYVMRKKIHFSIVLLKYSMNEKVSYDMYFEWIQRQLRNSDVAFKQLNGDYIILVLSISRVTEVKFFLNRLNEASGKIDSPIIATIAEIANEKYELETVLQRSIEALEDAVSQPIIIPDFLGKERELVKVSILENDTVAMSIFKNMLHNMDIPTIDLELQLFQDGLQFIQSEWYRSGHNHIVLLNDILPKKNGLEVLSYLRSLPNEQKYFIQFLSNRASEESLLSAIENGADGYFARPFNLRLLETQLKNYLRRLN